MPQRFGAAVTTKCLAEDIGNSIVQFFFCCDVIRTVSGLVRIRIEIADWILSDTTGAAKMANDITRLDGILAGIGGTDEEATVVAYVTKMINALGIGDYVKTTTMTTELGKKVDKVEGSRLMTNAEGTKLAGIAAAEGNHSHANKVFLDTLSGATDEEVTAMCTEVFGA